MSTLVLNNIIKLDFHQIRGQVLPKFKKLPYGKRSKANKNVLNV